jgi:hypothetical protein
MIIRTRAAGIGRFSSWLAAWTHDLSVLNTISMRHRSR